MRRRREACANGGITCVLLCVILCAVTHVFILLRLPVLSCTLIVSY